MRLYIEKGTYIETSEGIDISLPISPDGVLAWYLDPPSFSPVVENGFVGSVAEGGSVNFRTICFNPHGHGTHTECLGHLSREVHSINSLMKEYHFLATLITIQPEKIGNDLIITAKQLASLDLHGEAFILRTQPNEESKRRWHYSHTNPAYMESACADILRKRGVKHLLIDLPSVDKEQDDGKLAFHNAFWNLKERPDFENTITELIYVDAGIPDGIYLLNLQVAPFENDAAPSRPTLYKIHK